MDKYNFLFTYWLGKLGHRTIEQWGCPVSLTMVRREKEQWQTIEQEKQGRQQGAGYCDLIKGFIRAKPDKRDQSQEINVDLLIELV